MEFGIQNYCKRWQISDELIARPITFEDTEDVVRWRNLPEVRHYFIFQKPFTNDSHNEWMRTKVLTGQVEQFIVEVMPEHSSIGSVYLRDIDMTSKTAEYGIFIGEKKAQHHGYGTKMVKWILLYAKDVLNLEHISGRIYADNNASLAVAEHAGFTVIKKVEDYVQIDGAWRDMVFLNKDL